MTQKAFLFKNSAFQRLSRRVRPVFKEVQKNPHENFKNSVVQVKFWLQKLNQKP
jgi:hypothetical protein